MTSWFKYIRGELIGSGGFGNIYRYKKTFNVCECLSSSNIIGSFFDTNTMPIVGKVIPNVYLDSINREIDAMRKLDGVKGVVPLLDVIRDSENTTLIMPEYKQDLFTYITEDEYKIHDEDFTLYVIQTLKEIIFECHKKGVLHLDIKPENIMINDKKELVIIDFGSSFITPNGYRGTLNKMFIPHACGSETYSPPETKGYPAIISGKTDYWGINAVGFVVYYLIPPQSLPQNLKLPQILIIRDIFKKLNE